MTSTIDFNSKKKTVINKERTRSNPANKKPGFDWDAWVDRIDEAEDAYREWRVFEEETIRKRIPKTAADAKLAEMQSRIDELMKILGFPKNGKGEIINALDITTEFGNRRLRRIWDENVVEWDEMCKLMKKEDAFLN